LVDQLHATGGSARGVTLRGIAAGLQTLVDLPPAGPDEQEVLGRAAAAGLALTGLGDHWHQPGPHPQGLVVGFAAPPQRLFRTAVTILSEALR
jgi:GntR family transcriptional regulator/MocR family aminotransferase